MSRRDHRYTDAPHEDTSLTRARLQADLEEYRDMLTEALLARPRSHPSHPEGTQAPDSADTYTVSDHED